MGQGQSFCWNCGRMVTVNADHHITCRNYVQPYNPHAVHTIIVPPSGGTMNPPLAVPPLPLASTAEDASEEPQPSTQRCVRTLLVVLTCVIYSAAALCLILSLVFLSAMQRAWNQTDLNSARQATITCAAVGGALLLIGVVSSIWWCSVFCCCKKRWVCRCCGR